MLSHFWFPDAHNDETFMQNIRDYATIGHMLLEKGASIQDPSDISISGYDLAIKDGFAPIVQLHLDQGILAIDQGDDKGQTLLLLAVLSNSHDVAHLLNCAGVDLFRPDFEGNTPLQKAQDDSMVRIIYGLCRLSDFSLLLYPITAHRSTIRGDGVIMGV
ncbi:hypothetical protein BJX65DRAFT_307239 [Aspergillus insuetus]